MTTLNAMLTHRTHWWTEQPQHAWQSKRLLTSSFALLAICFVPPMYE